MSGKLEGKVAVITGESGIVWRPQAIRAEGAYIFITGRRQAELDAAVRRSAKTSPAFKATSRNSLIWTGCTPP